jgi:hypothetical protein
LGACTTILSSTSKTNAAAQARTLPARPHSTNDSYILNGRPAVPAVHLPPAPARCPGFHFAVTTVTLLCFPQVYSSPRTALPVP